MAHLASEQSDLFGDGRGLEGGQRAVSEASWIKTNMKNTIWCAAASVAFAVLAAPHVRASECLLDSPRWVGTEEAGSTWIVDQADSICGLEDPKMLSKPAKVDYETLLRATAEMKKIKDDKIDPNSPQGIQLREAAVTRVQTAAEKVRVSGGYCSVWKAIRHRDGRAIPDITESVRAQL